ncbi:fam-a protein [Plasmodium chabaudi chabaudi]|uniref:Fam-a protein n=1 Tax=Plasmodium chabaudi chabaudi TaxID=31271 RepID=A0A1C6WDI7_PLACU|nr:fam-a protein [Plasmodium chabaudi chabaudi]
MNKGCMNTVFAFLVLFAYASNKALASEFKGNITSAENTDDGITISVITEYNVTSGKGNGNNVTSTDPIKYNITPRESSLLKIAQQIAALNKETQIRTSSKNPGNPTVTNSPNKRHENPPSLLCEDREEIEKAKKNASKAVILLQKLAASTNGYAIDVQQKHDAIIYSKKIGNIDIGKLNVKIPFTDNYNDIINMLWDPNGIQKFDGSLIHRKVVRVYSQNLIMMEQSNMSHTQSPPQKRYALAARVKLSNDLTVILCPSTTLNYLNDSDEEVNMKEMLENTRAIETGIDPEEALTKLGANLSGFIIKKDDDEDEVDVTYINSIYDNGCVSDVFCNKKERIKKYSFIMSLEKNL